MKMQLREFFSIEVNGKRVLGPCEVELTEQEIKDNAHKLEVLEMPKVESASAPKSKKGKEKAD